MKTFSPSRKKTIKNDKIGRRVVVTGLGIVSSCGIGINDFWNSLINKKSGIKQITTFDASPFAAKWAGEIKDFSSVGFLDPVKDRRLDKCTKFSLTAAKLALADSSLKINSLDNSRVAICFGTSVGTLAWCLEQHEYSIKRGFRRIHPFAVVNGCYSSTSGHLSIENGFQGPSITICSGSASGANAIALGCEWIQDGVADIVIAGGGEAPLEPYIYGSFSISKALAPTNRFEHRALRPFDKLRQGTLLGEGSGMVVLESYESAVKRSARVYAEITGYGLSCDAHHLTVHEESGEGIARCIRAALENSSTAHTAIDLITAHGTGTPSNDVTETRAIKSVFNSRAKSIPITTIKPFTGHTLGASGAMGFVTTCLAISNNTMPPVLNLEEPDPECDLNYVTTTTSRRKITSAMCLAYGFGNKNVAIIIKSPH